MHFSIKRDFIMVFLFNALFVFLLIILGILSGTSFFWWVFFGIVFLLMVIYDTSVIFASCDLGEETLVFKTGMFRYDIPVNQIEKVEKSKNFYSSLAHSIDRIRILTIDEKGKQRVYYIAVDDNDKLMDLLNLRINKRKGIEQQTTTQENIIKNEVTSNENVVVESPSEETSKVEKKATAKKTTAKKSTSGATKKKSATAKKTTTKKSTASSKKTAKKE